MNLLVFGSDLSVVHTRALARTQSYKCSIRKFVGSVPWLKNGSLRPWSCLSSVAVGVLLGSGSKGTKQARCFLPFFGMALPLSCFLKFFRSSLGTGILARYLLPQKMEEAQIKGQGSLLKGHGPWVLFWNISQGLQLNPSHFSSMTEHSTQCVAIFCAYFETKE